MPPQLQMGFGHGLCLSAPPCCPFTASRSGLPLALPNRVLQGKLLASDSFPGQDRNKLCLASKVRLVHSLLAAKLMNIAH